MLRFEHGGNVYANPDVAYDFSVNTNPLGMPEGVKRAVAAHTADYARYPDPKCRALVRALAAHHGISADTIVCGNGAAGLIFRLCAMMRPKKALVLAPTFSEYEKSVRLFGGAAVEYKLNEARGFLPDDTLLESLASDIDIVFLCTPNNPTGRLFPLPLLRRVADICEKNGTLLVLDECFIDFTHGESMIGSLPRYNNLVILRAFTKLYGMAGLRLGYLLCAGAAFAGELAEFGQAWDVSGPAQAAGLAALREDGWVARTRAFVEAERLFLEKGLTGLGLTVFPGDANFLLVKSRMPLYRPLLERNILVRGCANFTDLDEHYIRIGIKEHETNEILISKIGEALNG